MEEQEIYIYNIYISKNQQSFNCDDDDDDDDVATTTIQLYPTAENNCRMRLLLCYAAKTKPSCYHLLCNQYMSTRAVSSIY